VLLNGRTLHAPTSIWFEDGTRCGLLIIFYKNTGSLNLTRCVRPSPSRVSEIQRSNRVYRRAAMDVIRGSPTDPELTTSPLTGTESSSLVTRRTTLQGSVVTMTSRPPGA
jgi:hypothetical protein